MSYIVVEDLAGKYNPGHVLTQQEGIKLSTAPGLTALPVDERMLGMGGVGGYFKREYGEGVPLKGPHALVARMALFLNAADEVTLFWAARVDLVPNAPGRSGSLRLASDTSQGVPSCGVVSMQQFDLRQLNDSVRDERGWVIVGRARARATVQSVFGFALHGQGVGFRVRWAALTQG